MKYIPVIGLCVLVWITVIIARTNSTNQLDADRAFAIGAVAVAWFVIGMSVQKILAEKEK